MASDKQAPRQVETVPSSLVMRASSFSSIASCPSRAELMEYSVGKLSNEASDTLANHLDSCPSCQAELDALPEPDDTLVARLRAPVAADPFLEEPGYEAAMARARAVLAGPGEADRSASEDPQTGFPQQLGEYHLIERLGSGGMGTVYKAVQCKLDREVALKVLNRTRTDDARAVARFEREMKAIGRLDHPHIVGAYDAREIDGRLVLAMEYVGGLDVGKLVRRMGRLNVADACELARQAALGLQAAHEHGLVHRDIKPSNLMLTPQGQVKLLDLGLARLHSEPTTEEETTGTGQVMGTADYMAPEQTASGRTVDIRADIYSLGCTLYKLLCGQAPFSGPEYPTALDKMMAHRQGAVPSIRHLRPEIPAGLAAVLDRMLAKDPEARFATPAEVAEALVPWCPGADLPALLQRAVETPCSPLLPGEGKSAGIAARQQSVPKLPLLLTSWGWKWFAGQLILLLVAGALGFALGIMIRIHKDGQETTIEVPEGSNARINADGELDVTLSGRTKPTATGAVPDEKAIQGTWEVLSSTFSLVRKLPYAKEVAPDQVLNTTKVIITCDTLKIVGRDVTDFAFQYRLNPGTDPKKIDLQTPGTTFGLISYGIYDFDEGRLKICTSGPRTLGEREAPDARALRPSEFWAGLGSGAELLVLRRVADAAITEDETAIQGTWRVEDGPSQSLMGFARNQQIEFSRHALTSWLPDGKVATAAAQVQYGYALDPTARPKRIDLGNVTDPPVTPVHGAYEMDSNRLTIYWAAAGAGCLPTGLRPSSGATVVVLKRVSKATDKASVQESAAGAPKGEPASAPPVVPASRPIVREITDHEDFTGRLEGSVGGPAGFLVFDVDQRTFLRLLRTTTSDAGLSPTAGKHDGRTQETCSDRWLHMPVLFALADDQGFPRRAEVVLVADHVDPKTGTVLWQARILEKDELLVKGMFARVRLITSGPHSALLVPERALKSDQGQTIVFVVNDRDVVQRRQVKVGQAEDGLRVVLDGLSATDWVITEPLLPSGKLVSPGMTVDRLLQLPPGSAVTMEPTADGARAKPEQGTRELAKPTAFATAPVTRGDLVETLPAVGTIEPEEVVDVGPQVEGSIVKLGDDPRASTDPDYKGKPIDYLSPVEEGTVLAEIDPAVYQARYDQEAAALKKAKADVALAEGNVARAKQSQQSLADAQAALASAQAAVAQSEAALRLAQTSLSRTVIKSPVRGVIIARRARLGQNVAPTPGIPSLFLIAKDINKLQVRASVNEANVGRIRNGMEVNFNIDAFPGEVFKGTVVQVRPNATRTQNVVTYTVVVEMEKPNRKLLPYMTAHVRFVFETRRNVLRVPNAALRWMGPLPGPGPEMHCYLDLKEPDGTRVRSIGVQVGPSDGTFTEVSGPDVKEGMEVVIGEVPEVVPAGTKGDRMPTINVNQDGTITLDDKPITLAELPERLSRHHEQDREVYVAVRADRQCEFRRIREVISVCEAAKVKGVRMFVSNAAEVTPPASTKGAGGTAVPAVSPAAEFRALQGRWKVVRVEKGKHADASWGKICQYEGAAVDPATTRLLKFYDAGNEPSLQIQRLGPMPASLAKDLGRGMGGGPPAWRGQEFQYRIDPTAATRSIDLLQGFPGQTPQLAAVGIYEMRGDQLKICLTEYLVAIQGDQRPKSLAPQSDSGEVLFVLERDRPSADEAAVLPGRWDITALTRDGQSQPQEKLSGACAVFVDGEVMIFGDNPRIAGSFSLDPSKKPKEITIFTSDIEHGTLAPWELHGIYDFQGGRLTIAYRKGAPPPEKFESTPGSGVTLLVLERQKPQAGPKPNEPTSGNGQTRPEAAQSPGTAVVEPEEAKPQGPILVYEIDPDLAPGSTSTADMEKLLKVVEKRLNPGTEKVANVAKLDDKRVEIALLRPDDADRQRVERLLARRGTLEFRVLANSRDHKPIIEQAQRDATKSEVLDSAGKRLAWWVPVLPDEGRNFAAYSDIARRTRNERDREILEILVVKDRYDVTGEYLVEATVARDSMGKPCVDFAFNKKGADLFGALTGDNLPDPAAPLVRRLGIILDGQLFSAPGIQSVIRDRGQISGAFTEQEAHDLADRLNSGSLPVRLHPAPPDNKAIIPPSPPVK